MQNLMQNWMLSLDADMMQKILLLDADLMLFDSCYLLCRLDDICYLLFVICYLLFVICCLLDVYDAA